MTPAFQVQNFTNGLGSKFTMNCFDFLKECKSNNFSFDFDGELVIEVSPEKPKKKRRSATEILLQNNVLADIRSSKLPRPDYETRSQTLSERENVVALKKEIQTLRKSLENVKNSNEDTDDENKEDDEIYKDDEFSVSDLKFLQTIISDGCIKKVSALTLRISYRLILEVIFDQYFALSQFNFKTNIAARQLKNVFQIINTTEAFPNADYMRSFIFLIFRVNFFLANVFISV